MQFDGKLKSVNYNPIDRAYDITISTHERPCEEEIDKLMKLETARVEVVKASKRRSLDANAYLWVLLQKIAESVKSDKWSVYLQMLQRYGVFTHVIVKPNAAEAMKREWRTCIELGEVNVNGQTGIQLQCYFGSHTYDTKQMSVLIDGVVSEAKELGIETLTPRELAQMKAEWGGKDG